MSSADDLYVPLGQSRSPATGSGGDSYTYDVHGKLDSHDRDLRNFDVRLGKIETTQFWVILVGGLGFSGFISFIGWFFTSVKFNC
jgi:hypothetical protein